MLCCALDSDGHVVDLFGVRFSWLASFWRICWVCSVISTAGSLVNAHALAVSVWLDAFPKDSPADQWSHGILDCHWNPANWHTASSWAGYSIRCIVHCNTTNSPVAIPRIDRNYCNHSLNTIDWHCCWMQRRRPQLLHNLWANTCLVMRFLAFVMDTVKRTMNRMMAYTVASCCNSCSTLVCVQMNLNSANSPNRMTDLSKTLKMCLSARCWTIGQSQSMNSRRVCLMLDFDFPISQMYWSHLTNVTFPDRPAVYWIDVHFRMW